MNLMRISLIVAMVFYFLCLKAQAQTILIDSLKTEYKKSNVEKDKQKVLLKICEQYYSLSADSLAKYVNLGLSYSPKNTSYYFRFKNFYCFYFLKNGKTIEANKYCDSLLKEVSSLENNQRVRIDIIYHKTISLIRNGQYQEGIDSSLKYLGYVEQLKDTLSILRAHTLLGWANMELDSDKEALKWLRNGMQVTTNKNIVSQSSALYTNISSVYNNQGLKDSALYFVNLGLKYSILAQNLGNQANALNIRADIYSKTNRLKEAQKDLEDGLQIRKAIGDLPYVLADMGQLSRFYAFTHQTDKGIEIAKKGIELAIQAGNLSKLIFLTSSLGKNYQVANRINEYAETLSQLIVLRDSMYEKNSEDAIAEMLAKYELQKKENIIIQQENTLLKTRYISFGSAIAFVLASIIIWLVYRNYTHIQQRKMEKALAEEKIHSIQAVKQAEEKERKRIAADLHDNLGSFAAAIASNIRYLKEDTKKDKAFIISQLDENAQGIVTQLSDTIWVLKNEQLPITSLADRFKSWTQRIMQNYPQIKYYFKEEIDNDFEITPSKTLNIFLILKECLNNALKHSTCSEISIEFKSQDHLLISIEDNGIGFDANLSKHGNGIENIKFRAEESNLQVSWHSVVPHGSKVVITE